MRISIAGLLLLACPSASVHLALAQAVLAASQTGNPTNTSADLHGTDSVNTQGLGLHIEIPLLSLQERGRTYTWKYVYNAPSYEILFQQFTNPAKGSPTGNWEVVPPYPAGNSLLRSPGPDNWLLAGPTSWYLDYDPLDLTTSNGGSFQCNLGSGYVEGAYEWTVVTYNPENNFRLVDPEGTQHPLGMQAFNITQTQTVNTLTNTAPAPACPSLTSQLTSPTLDGSGAYYDSTQHAFWLKDGTKYSLSTPTSSIAIPSVVQVEDSNGNILGPDMMNRIGLETLPPVGNTQQYKYNDSNGKPQLITVTLSSVTYQTNECSIVAAYLLDNQCIEASGSLQLPTSISFPSGNPYQFQYNQGGHLELTSMMLPTGATVAYTYQQILTSRVTAKGGTAVYHYGVHTRTETLGSTTNLWTYGITGAPDQGSYTTSVEDPLQNCVLHTYGPVLSTFGSVEQSTVFQNGCGGSAPAVKTVNTTYGYDSATYPGLSVGAYNIRPTAVRTILASGQTSQIQTDYDSFTFGASSLPGSWMNPTEVREYDFGAGSPTRTTDYQYLYLTGSSTQPASQYLAHHMVTKLTKEIVSVAPGAPVQTTAYDYDNYGAGISASGVSQSRDLTYGNWGNATSRTVTDGITNKSYKTTYAYEDTGNVLAVTDPRGETTAYSYADTWSDSTCALTSGQGHVYLTKITNMASQPTAYAFNSCSGSLASITDPNHEVTSLTYDSLGRTLQLTYPDQGGKQFTYVDTPPVQMVTAENVNAAQMIATITYDGLGRPITKVVSDSYGPDVVTTTYDGNGDISSVSNPYRTSDSTYGITTFAYDALGRKILQTQPDKSSLQWCYDGVPTSASQTICNTNKSSVSAASWVDSSDELVHVTQHVSDGLGRLRSVMEPDPVSGLLAMETDYSYDVLNDLLTVNQKGEGTDSPRARSFTYDGFARLICAANVETSRSTCPLSEATSLPAGVLSYGYDADGNVITKTDSRGITTSFTYDVLNRLLSKTFSNDAACTPFSFYQYDLTSVQNGVGRLSTEWTQSASSSACPASLPASGVLARRSIIAYDAMGRVLNEKQYTLANQASGAVYAPAYTYDFAGNLVTSTDGTTASPTTSGTTLTFTNTYDGTEHLLAVQSNWADATHPSPLFSVPSAPSTSCANSSTAPYTAFGALQNAAYGAGLTLNRGYDLRLRTTCEVDTGTNAAATSGTATVTINGLEQTKQ